MFVVRCRAIAISVALVLFVPTLLGQSIHTSAGGGTASVEGLLARDVLLASVRGLAVDAAGNVYVSDEDTNTVYRITPSDGRIAAFAGNGGGSFSGDGGPARLASLRAPRGIAFDAAGNLYIADHDNGRVRRVQAGTNTITTVAGSEFDPKRVGNGDGGAATSAYLRNPTSVAWHDGNLYIADKGYNENNVRMVDAQGVISTVAGKRGRAEFSGDDGLATAAGFSAPNAVALDGAGNLYIADSENRRVRRVDAQTKIITTVVGGGTPADDVGDNGVGTDAKLVLPTSLVFDASGKLYIADAYHRYGLVRRWDPSTRIVQTVAGNGTYSGGDGQVATNAGLYAPFALAIDALQNLYVQDSSNGTVRKVDATTQIIDTIAGGGGFIGDGRVATAAILQQPQGLALDRTGNLLIADTAHNIVRKVDAVTGVISTFAGVLKKTGGFKPGLPATETPIGFPVDVAVDAQGKVYLADPYGGRVLRVDSTGKIEVYAGGGTDSTGGTGPATSARLSPLALAFDGNGNLYIVDNTSTGPHRIRKVDAQTNLISTIAGGESSGFAGDDGPATSALLSNPRGIAVDRVGNVFIADHWNLAIRRIDALTGKISTYAGRGNPTDGVGDGLPATEAVVFPHHIAIDARNDDLYIADQSGHRLRKIDARTRIITTVAGSGTSGFSGDLGAATKANLNFSYDLSGVVVDSDGTVHVADTKNDRVRTINACAEVGAATLLEPAAAALTSTAPSLRWQSASPRNPAVRYDVYLSTDSSASTLIASDVLSTSLTLSNLRSGATYYWRIVTKGDRFCPTLSTAASTVRSFGTAAGCDAPAEIALVAPADNASISATSIELSWASAAGAGTYDVLFGTTNPPPLGAGGRAGNTFTVGDLAAGTTYYWGVIAHASCDRVKTTVSVVRSFLTAGACPSPAPFTLLSPSAGASSVPFDTTLEWSPSANATSYDLYLGTGTNPALFQRGLTTTSVSVAGLLPGTTYAWRVVANVACDVSRTASSVVGMFTIRRECRAAGATSFAFVPAGSVATGQTYVVAWNAAGELDADGYYLVERSLSSSFAPLFDRQTTTATSATFVAGAAGTIYHRVRAINPCTSSSTASESRTVTVVAAPPNVIFTVQPQAVVTALGESLEGRRGRFVLENISDQPVSVIVGRQEIDSVPFFTIRDPQGGDPAILELLPRQPKEMELRFSGPLSDVAGSYQGIIFLAALGRGLAITPYAFVSLRVGGEETATPQFRISGSPTEYAFFPGFGGDDATRPPISVDIHNPGTTPMELGGEIGPELWLVPETGWNAIAIPPGGTRTVRLFTRRNRAPNGSALPRYTYFRVRTRSGQTARLLVQDNDVPQTAYGRGAALDPATRSMIVSDITSGTSSRSILRVSNLSSDAVQVELFFTPRGADGFDGSLVRRATLVVPANDVVVSRDPLLQLWGLTAPAAGQIEVRTDPARLGSLSVRAEVVTSGSAGGEYGYPSAVHTRGDGASLENTHVLFGVASDNRIRPVLTLAETSGVDRVTVRITMDDKEGNRIGQRSEEIARYGSIELDEVVTMLGAQAIDAARITIEVISGGGSVAGVLKLIDRVTGGGIALVSAPLQPSVPSNLRGARTDAIGSRSYFLPAVINDTGGTTKLQSTIGLVASGGAASFTLTYRDATATRTATANVSAGKTVEYANVLEQLLGLPAGSYSEGTLLIETNDSGRVYGRLTSPGEQKFSIAQELIIIGSDSELLTSPGSQRPVFLDGLTQSIDPALGTKWSLMLSELSGQAGSVIVRLYEAGNRDVPIAESLFQLTAFKTLALSDLFAAMGLSAPNRQKDRANVLVSVAWADGQASVAAVARSLDNITRLARSFVLAPAGSAPIASKVSVVAPATAKPVRRRGVRH